jgi:hypothetical protein
MRRLFFSALAAVSLFLSPATIAAPLIVPGQVSQEHVYDLTSQIPWYHSLNQAEDAARRQGKLIFWVHMLGTLDGAT